MSRTKTDTDKKTCTRCGKKRAPTKNNWYYSNSPLFINDGLFPVCKDCINQLVDSSNIDTVHWMLRMMDRVWRSDLWDAALKEVNDRGVTRWSSYMKLIAMPQNQGLTWKDSDHLKTDAVIIHKKESEKIREDIENKEEFIKDDKLSEEELKRWRGFNKDDALILEDMYQELASNYESSSPIQKNLYKNICITQMKADKAIAEGKHKEYKDLMDTLSKLMNDANIKPVQKTGAEASGISSFGEFIKMIEETEPIPEPSEEFKDVDNIEKYINKWFVHPFARAFGLTNETMEEYDARLIAEEDGDK